MTKHKITAVLGPTNTGKTHLAIETMLSFESGMIGFPLRLLAREVYDKVVRKVGKESIIVAATTSKLHALLGKPLRVDTGDQKLNNELSGYIQVTTGYKQNHLVNVV